MEKFLRASGPVALAIALGVVVAIALGVAVPAEEPVARSYSCAVYTEQGCAKFVVASGGEIEIQSGGTLDLQSGATTDFSGGVDLDGAELIFDANGNTSMQADTDDQIDIKVSGADDFQITANTFTAVSGSTIKANTIAETTGANGVAIDGLTVKDGGIQDTGGFPITGQADVAQLTVTGYTTQTSTLVVLEQSGGTDVVTVTNAGALAVAGGLTVNSGGATVTAGGLTLSDGDAVIADDARITAQSAISVTDSSVITPTGTYQPLESAGNVTATLAAGTAGDLLILVNTASTTIKVQEGSTAKMTGSDTDLGQYDSLWMIFDGTYWIELAQADN